jgi:hypothetical protein
MATFTICIKYILRAHGDTGRFNRVLNHFACDGPLRIAVDCRRKLLDEYEKLASGSDLIAAWLKLVSLRSDEIFENVKDVPEAAEGTDLCFEICIRQVVNKRLICDSMQEYRAYPIEKHNVELIDKAAAPYRVFDAIKGESTVNIIGAITMGPQSPIQQGDGNETKAKA